MSDIRMVRIKEHIREGPDQGTVVFEDIHHAVPGQFCMVWIPGVDEVPMSYSRVGLEKAVTYQAIGPGTRALAALDKGAPIGIRGPYGSGYRMGEGFLWCVSGGTGSASVAPLAVEHLARGGSVQWFAGARDKDHFILDQYLRDKGADVLLATDDGSVGFHGFVTDLLKEHLERGTPGWIATCGPELMMAKVADMGVSAGIPTQLALERYMKCGVGLCDACDLGDRLLCKTGPVFGAEEALKIPAFGKWHRDASGVPKPW